MKKHITFVILLISSLGAFAQVTREDLDKEIKQLTEKIKTNEVDFTNKIEKLKNDKSALKAEIGNLNSELSSTNKSIDSLRSQTKENSSAISQTANLLGIQIKEIGEKNENKITEVSKSLSKNSLYGIIGVLSAILLSGFLFWLLSKRQQTDKTDFIDQLSKTKSSIEESLVKEFGKQTELMDSQLHLIERQKTTLQASPNAEPDHSLALKVASEINLIERNINLMDSKTKGLKQLQASVGKLKDNLSANGYEMPELLGKPFNQGMRVIVATSIPDENLEKGVELITKILIPQINFNDKMIQTAQIEVSVGY
jgi:hypothetical protein